MGGERVEPIISLSHRATSPPPRLSKTPSTIQARDQLFFSALKMTSKRFGMVDCLRRYRAGTIVGNGLAGGPRATRRWAAMIYGVNGGNSSDPKVDRVKADAAGCDAAALAAPCFDIGTTYQASFSTATWSGNIVTISGGLAAHARPFVVGQAFSCSGCNSELVITSLSVPPTQSTVAGAGEVGQTFTFTAKNAAGQAIGGSGSGAVTGGCSGVSGTGSNCIDVAISLNVGGTFGTRRRSTLAAQTTSTATRRITCSRRQVSGQWDRRIDSRLPRRDRSAYEW